jgi:iron complex transport system substrate-binding protein
MWGGKPKLVADSSGKTRTLTRPLRHIVVMNSETLETLRSLGVSPSVVVAVDKYTAQKPEFFPEYKNTPSVGSIWAPDYERILAARPDAVFLYATVSSTECDEIEKRITAANPEITVFRVDSYHPSTYLADVKILGEIFDKKKESERLTAFYTSIQDSVAAGHSSGQKPDVYFETWTDYKSASEGSGYHDKIVIAGGENIFAESAAEYPEIDPEAIIASQPAVVVKLVGSGSYVFGGYSGENTTRFPEVKYALLSRPGWNTLPAVRDRRVFIIHNAILGGPQYVIGTAYLASWFFPDEYPDLDPAAIHRMYLRDFQGLDESLARPERFVYPVP